jgi:hypothetical protein
MQYAFLVLTTTMVLFCASGLRASAPDDPGARYVRLALALDVATNGGYVFAYRGPMEDRQKAGAEELSISQIGSEVRDLIVDIDATHASGIEAQRLAALRFQLSAMLARIDVLQGEVMEFDKEAFQIFGVRPPRYSTVDANAALRKADKLLPGEGSLAERAAAFQGRLKVPKEQQEVVFRAVIDACRTRTAEHISLPRGEALEIVFVDDLPASGRYDYLGNYRGRVTVNKQADSISNALYLGCHEAYPGHHLHAILNEERYGGHDWPERHLETLFGPAHVLSEGLGQYAVDLAMPDVEKLRFYRDELFPLAGLDPDDAERLVALSRAKEALRPYATIEVSRAYLDGHMGHEEAIDLLAKYSLQPREQMRGMFGFVDAFRTFVATYSLGHEFVRKRIDAAGKTPSARWTAFRDLNTALVTPELMGLDSQP